MFFDKVYDAVKKIPCGKVSTYGQIARMTGFPKKAREVGWALHANKQFITVPCHRVVDRFGRLAKSFVFGGEEQQKRLLQSEGVEVVGNKVNLKIYLFIQN
ncbi:MAG: MGMT family protein [Clostridia bacterium]|nr:MGMT family protein [Clostridia bacterium]